MALAKEGAMRLRGQTLASELLREMSELEEWFVAEDEATGEAQGPCPPSLLCI